MTRRGRPYHHRGPDRTRNRLAVRSRWPAGYRKTLEDGGPAELRYKARGYLERLGK